MKFLNKLYTKAIFSDDNSLNVIAADMGEDMIKVSLDGEVVNRLPTATGTVGSLSIFVPVTVEISILKTSPLWPIYIKRCASNGYIGGTLTIYDDVNLSQEIEDVSLDVQDLSNFNGTQPAVTFIVKGNFKVNREALTL